jgi:hypothetical protein
MALARARAAKIGSDFDLGTLTDVKRMRKFPASYGLGILLGAVVLIVAIVVIAGTAPSSHYAASSKVTIVVVFAVLLLACGTSIAIGWRRAKNAGWLFRYSGGFAQQITGEPEPRAVRWNSVDAFTVIYFTPTRIRSNGRREAGSPRVDGVFAHPPVGTVEPEFSTYPWKREARVLAIDGTRAVGPRLASPLIDMYESGKPVIKGGIEISPTGIMSIPWDEVTSISVINITRTDLPHHVYINRVGGPTARKIDLSGVENGVALVELIRHAAAGRGLSLSTHRNVSY